MRLSIQRIVSHVVVLLLVHVMHVSLKTCLLAGGCGRSGRRRVMVQRPLLLNAFIPLILQGIHRVVRGRVQIPGVGAQRVGLGFGVGGVVERRWDGVVVRLGVHPGVARPGLHVLVHVVHAAVPAHLRRPARRYARPRRFVLLLPLPAKQINR